VLGVYFTDDSSLREVIRGDGSACDKRYSLFDFVRTVKLHYCGHK
jgi:hypothetical protein